MSDLGADIRRETLISNADPVDFLALLKPRVMSLVVFTALVGMILAPGGIHPVIGMIAVFSIAVGAGASGALNMWYDADIDAVMRPQETTQIVLPYIDRHQIKNHIGTLRLHANLNK